jgi:RNA polymerase sigma-70 factor, ECF subfamily
MFRNRTDGKQDEREAPNTAEQRDVQQTLGGLARAAVGPGYEKRGRYVEWKGMPERVEPRDDHLLRRMATGDEEAFRLFYTRHQGPIYRFALHMTGRREAAEEVVQEAFMTLIQKADKFEAERGEPQAFLYGIARNHVRRLLERERRYEPLTEEADVRDAAHDGAIGAIGGRNGHSSGEVLLGELSRGEAVDQVRHAITMLPSHYREAVTLCDLQGRDYASAAKILDCPIGTVRSRLARGREMLASRLRGIPAGARNKR